MSVTHHWTIPERLYIYIYIAFILLLVRHKPTKGFSDNQHCYNIRGAYDKFPDFVRMATFIDSTHMKL